MRHWLDFEKQVEELERKLGAIAGFEAGGSTKSAEEAYKLEKKARHILKELYSNLTPAQVTQVARHQDRPYSLDYFSNVFEDFIELHGDRHFKDDPAIVCGLARFDGLPVVVIGHQKGRNTKEKVYRKLRDAESRGVQKGIEAL